MPVPTSEPTTERQLLRDTVRNRLREAILDGTLEPGERLHDDELVAWLQVSRTPIREALSDLVRAGLVEMAPNRWTRVATPDAGRPSRPSRPWASCSAAPSAWPCRASPTPSSSRSAPP